MLWSAYHKHFQQGFDTKHVDENDSFCIKSVETLQEVYYRAEMGGGEEYYSVFSDSREPLSIFFIFLYLK